MEIIVHYPKEPDRLHDLQKKVAAVHAQAVVRRIKSTPCPKEQKEKLLQEIINNAR